jgi:hypothetical protein
MGSTKAEPSQPFDFLLAQKLETSTFTSWTTT